jgi:hypothetical protein
MEKRLNKYEYALSQIYNENNYVIYIDDNPVMPNGAEDKEKVNNVYTYLNMPTIDQNMSIIKLQSNTFGGITNYIGIKEILRKLILSAKNKYKKIIVIFDFDCTLLYSHAFLALMMGSRNDFYDKFCNYLSDKDKKFMRFFLQVILK